MKDMKLVYYLVLLALFMIGGPLMGAIAAAAGIIMIFYMAFEWGPKLSLIALPVIICFILCMWLDDFAWMYVKHMSLYVLICLVVTIAFCHYYYGEDYKKIVIAVTAGFAVITMVLLAFWMYKPRDFSVPNRTAKIEIQRMSESQQVVYTDPEEFEEFLEKLERVEMRGTFKELITTKGSNNTYRLTFRNKRGKEIKTYYFFSKFYIAKSIGKRYIYYRWAEDSEFPYVNLVGMYNNVVSPDQ